MKLTRKQFGIGMVAAGFGAGMTAQATEVPNQAAKPPAGNKPAENLPTTPMAAHQASYFFKNSAFEYVLLTSLGRAYHQGGNVGKVLYLTRQIEDGNFDSAYSAMMSAGDEALTIAQDSLSGGHKESARQALLWAQNY